MNKSFWCSPGANYYKDLHNKFVLKKPVQPKECFKENICTKKLE